MEELFLQIILWRFKELKRRGIFNNRATLREWMKLDGPMKDDPFPPPIVLINDGKRNRSVAWRAIDVEQWLLRRERAGRAVAERGVERDLHPA